MTTFTNVCAIILTESEVAVFPARGDRSAIQILQVRQRIALHVPGVVHQTAASQSDGILWPVMWRNESFEAMTVWRWRTECVVVNTEKTVGLWYVRERMCNVRPVFFRPRVAPARLACVRKRLPGMNSGIVQRLQL